MVQFRFRAGGQRIAKHMHIPSFKYALDLITGALQLSATFGLLEDSLEQEEEGMVLQKFSRRSCSLRRPGEMRMHETKHFHLTK